MGYAPQSLRFTHPTSSYDRNGNRLWKYNAVNTARSELYTYDDLNQIVTYGRGTLNGGKTALTTTIGSQAWGYDAAGNWDYLTTGVNTQTRAHNRRNEIVNFDGDMFPAYDANGNMTKALEDDRLFVYDAWNKLVKLTDYPFSTVLAAYANDALNRRVTSTVSSVTTDRYFSSSWQLLETDVSTSAKERFVWSPVYVDAMVLRNRSVSGTLDDRIYALQDANFNVTALANTSGSIVERIAYTPFGVPSFMNASWTAAADAYAWTFLHQGGERGAADLYLFRNRSYSATLGRWMQEDPIGYESLDANYFRYELNNPLVDVDPYGFTSLLACAASPAAAAVCLDTFVITAAQYAAIMRNFKLAAGVAGGAVIGGPILTDVADDWWTRMRDLLWGKPKPQPKPNVNIPARPDAAAVPSTVVPAPAQSITPSKEPCKPIDWQSVTRRYRYCYKRYRSDKVRCFAIADREMLPYYPVEDRNRWRRECLERANDRFWICLRQKPYTRYPEWKDPWNYYK